MDTEDLKKEIKKCFKEHKELDDKLMCSFDKVADSIERNSELIEDNKNISKVILNIVKGNAHMLEEYSGDK